MRDAAYFVKVVGWTYHAAQVSCLSLEKIGKGGTLSGITCSYVAWEVYNYPHLSHLPSNGDRMVAVVHVGYQSWSFEVVWVQSTTFTKYTYLAFYFSNFSLQKLWNEKHVHSICRAKNYIYTTVDGKHRRCKPLVIQTLC